MKRALLVLGLGLVVAAPAGATHGGIHPTFRTEKVYFHCTGTTKVQNVNWFAEGAASHGGWNTTAPAQSVQAGAGCGSLDTGVFRGTPQSSPYDAVFQGIFVGNLRNLTVQLHNLLLSQARTVPTFNIRVRGSIDGSPIFPENAGRTLTLTPVLSSTGLSEYMEFSITNLGFAKDIFDSTGKLIDVETGGLATEDGDGAQEHDVLLAIDGVGTERLSAWVWDTTEVPAGLLFNPSALATAKVNADLPNPGGE